MTDPKSRFENPRFEPPGRWEPSISNNEKWRPTRVGPFRFDTRLGVDVDSHRPWRPEGASIAFRIPQSPRAQPAHRPPLPQNLGLPRRTGPTIDPPPGPVRSRTERLILKPGATPGIRPQRRVSPVRVPITNPKTFRDHALNLQSVVTAAAHRYVRQQSGFGFGTRPHRQPIIIRRR